MVVRKLYFSFGIVMVMTITLTQVRDKSKFKEPDLKHPKEILTKQFYVLITNAIWHMCNNE
jgi:hypothetical protein